MVTLLEQSGNTTYGLRKYILDTEADVKDLPKEDVLMGSTATVIDSGKEYVFSSQRKEWLLDKSSVGGSIGSTGEQIKVSGVIQAELLDGTIGRNKINEAFETDLRNLEKNTAENAERIDTNAVEISQLKEDLGDVRDIEYSRNLFDVSKFLKDKEISSNGTIIDSTNKVGITDFIDVSNKKLVYFSKNGSSLPRYDLFFISEFDSKKNAIKRITATDANYIYTPSDNARYIRCCVKNSIINSLQIEYDEITPFKPYGERKTNLLADNITEIETEIEELKEKGTSIYELPDNPLSRINDCPELLSCFFNVGCIGDSLASGVAVYKDTQGQLVVNSVNRYPYSWGKYLERMTGNTYYNWSAGGLRTDTWLSSSYATECFDGKHLCQAYIIGLGQNDNNKSQGSDIGTSADIDLSDYKNNAESFYGRYAKIIQKIKEVQPKAKIFVVTDPNDSVDANGYNVAIRKMAELFKFVYVLDMRKYWNDAPCKILLNNQKRYGHFNAVGYYLIAKMMMTYIDWIMQKHWEDFREIENIGTDWYYYDELK